LADSYFLINSTNNSTLLTALGNNLKFIDVDKINLNDIKAAVTFKMEWLSVKPFNIKYKDIGSNHWRNT
jgi:PHP family Zn ribbon phosphoesterase